MTSELKSIDITSTLRKIASESASHSMPELASGLSTKIVFGEQNLRSVIPAIQELRRHSQQESDLTTDPQYFIANNAQTQRRVAAVLIYRSFKLDACVYFYEHCRFGVGLGVLRGGDTAGDGLVAGPHDLRLQYAALAIDAALRHWRIHTISLAIMAPEHLCIQILGPPSKYRMFFSEMMERELSLKSTYSQMLLSFGPRTRRSLAGKRRLLEERTGVVFLPSIAPGQALSAMLDLSPKSTPMRAERFYHCRYHLSIERPNLFSMAMRLPDGVWLSFLSGWRIDRVTYIDLQMNNNQFKKESISAVMRSYLLEHEIANKQEAIKFVGGTSILLKRYCQPVDASTFTLIRRPSFRGNLLSFIGQKVGMDSVYKRTLQSTKGTSLATKTDE
jgi:hypothetical protein